MMAMWGWAVAAMSAVACALVVARVWRTAFRKGREAAVPGRVRVRYTQGSGAYAPDWDGFSSYQQSKAEDGYRRSRLESATGRAYAAKVRADRAADALESRPKSRVTPIGQKRKVQ